MKHRLKLCLGVLVFLLVGCSNQTPKEVDQPQSNQTETDQNETNTVLDTGKILVLYFTMPESLDYSGSDSNSQASIVVSDNSVYGNVEYVANIIHEVVGGDILEIETEQNYPLDHDELVDLVSEEKEKQIRPTLTTNFDYLDKYDTVFIGYPIWWYDLPMPLYTFLETYNLDGKTVIPFTVHGGSGFSTTVDTLKRIQPNASVSDDGFSISRNTVSTGRNALIDWLNATFDFERITS